MDGSAGTRKERAAVRKKRWVDKEKRINTSPNSLKPQVFFSYLSCLAHFSPVSPTVIQLCSLCIVGTGEQCGEREDEGAMR